MITIAYSTRESNPEFKEHLIKSSGFKKLTVIEKVNNGEKSLAQVYNEVLRESETNIVVFCHDDIYFETNNWYSKLLKHFEKTDFGIIGMAGTTSLPKSGMWWEDTKKMVGIVNHEHDGKKWESRYSESSYSDVFETIIVDGLFLAINKDKIIHNFDESFDGFHFYDLPFCFKNHLSGVKVGVITNIRLTHKSIGVTNEKWEENRVKFSNMFSDVLPKKLPFDPNRKIKVLISSLFFSNFTGSELYVYELAKNLVKNNCDVTVISNIGGPLTDMAKQNGIKVFPHENPPGFKLGDGVWGFNTQDGVVVSEKNRLYKVSRVYYDVIHIQHKPVAERIVQLYPDIPKVYSIHSEIISLEDPIKHESIKKYIAIRPEIKDYIVNKFDISDSDVEVVYNPVDPQKFKKTNTKEENALLFVGTLDYLRYETIKDLIEYCKKEGLKLWLVGEDKFDFLKSEIYLENKDIIVHHNPTWMVDQYVNRCKETAGIQLGRTTIEGWMSGKPGWIYKVDDKGQILEKAKHEPPQDVDKFNSDNVSKKIKEIYLNYL
jgi:glycosyltransferase involved in cell wall biosynthesis